MRRHSSIRDPRRAGFTLVELLVTIAIISILLGIAIVGLFSAQSFARRAAGQAQLQSIAQALDAFQGDVGWYPPLISHLDASTDAVETPETLAAAAPKASRRARLAEAYREARFMSEWTIGAFLVGEGDLNGDRDADEDDLNLDDGKQGNGIRNPGESRAWKAPDGSHAPQTTGLEYGPYLDPGMATKFLRRVQVEYSDTRKRIVESDDSRQYLYRIVDAFEVPVRYYQGWPTRDSADDPSLAQLPVELRTEAGVEKQIDTGRAAIEPERNLMTAPYALLAAGERADRNIDKDGIAYDPFGDVLNYTVQGSGTNTKFMQADTNGVYQDQSGTPEDLAALNLDAQRVLLKFLKSNIRYIP